MTKKTVFVIGAGASKEAGLPTGYELKSKISNLLDIRFRGGTQLSGDYEITNAIRLYVKYSDESNGDINPYLYEAWHIRDALLQAISIDNFIDQHRDNNRIALCGKLAIVKSILDAEKHSNLWFERSKGNSNIKFSAIEKTWYIPFFQLLTENCTKNDLEERLKSITLIIFNYDRCIEHFIYHSLQNFYRIDGDKAAELIKIINIYHPYGNVGTLPWIKRNGGIEFGSDPQPNDLLQQSQKIKTFTEGTDPSASEILEIRKHMGTANKVVFLGFAFHKLNMQLLKPENVDGFDSTLFKCFSTTLGISRSDKEVISNQLCELYGRLINVEMGDSTCHQFFVDYYRSLSF